MGNDFLFMFMMFTMMNDKDRPIPMEAMISSLDAVPAPMRFMVTANTIQNVEADCLAEDDNLRAQVRDLVTEMKIPAADLAEKWPRVAEFIGSGSPSRP